MEQGIKTTRQVIIKLSSILDKHIIHNSVKNLKNYNPNLHEINDSFESPKMQKFMLMIISWLPF